MSAERLALVKAYCLPLRTWGIAPPGFEAWTVGARPAWPRNVSERWTP